MEKSPGALHFTVSRAKRLVVSTFPLLLVLRTFLLALLILASGVRCTRTGVVTRGKGSSSTNTDDEIIFSPHFEAARDDRAILLDCDEQALPMMLNFMLNMNKFFDLEDIVDMTHVVCLDEKSCRTVSEIGLRIASEGIANAIHDGFKGMAKKVEPVQMGPGNVPFTGNWLDDVMLAREYALIDLLKQKKVVLRSDADTCFQEDPFMLLSSAKSDIAISAQKLDPGFQGGFWAYDWSCPDSKESKLELTLNNGVIVVDGRKKAARETYGLAVGSGIKLLYHRTGGWGQRGFNALLHDENLCLRPVGAGKDTLRGQTSRGVSLVSMDVCSPCEKCTNTSSSALAHANCIVDAGGKSTWLQQVSCWEVPSDWKEVRRNGDAVDYLRRLRSRGRNATEHRMQPQQEERVFTSTRVVDFMGQRARVPVQNMRGIRSSSVFTTLLTVDPDKFHFALHTMKTLREKAGVRAFLLLCPSCTSKDMRSLKKRGGVTLLTVASLREMVDVAFREGGPMSMSKTSADGKESRRHSPHTLYREWIKFLLLEKEISVLVADVDVCYFDAAPPFLTSSADIVVEGYWPNNFRHGSYSFPMLREATGENASVVLNSGHAFFAATVEGREFSRMFMGLMTSEVYEDFGFARTSFMKTLHATDLELFREASTHLGAEAGISGTTKRGMKVEAFQLVKYGHHAVGSDWNFKQAELEGKQCWRLCRDWKEKWKRTEDLETFFLEC